MKQRFIRYRRSNGTYYCEDTETRKQQSLKTKDEAAAKTLLESHRIVQILSMSFGPHGLTLHTTHRGSRNTRTASLLAFGPAALGTSAFSPVLKDWAQGGPIGIHGTNEPWVIGHAASHGCIRLPNAAMSKLFRLTPAGTPILIRA